MFWRAASVLAWITLRLVWLFDWLTTHLAGFATRGQRRAQARARRA